MTIDTKVETKTSPRNVIELDLPDFMYRIQEERERERAKQANIQKAKRLSEEYDLNLAKSTRKLPTKPFIINAAYNFIDCAADVVADKKKLRVLAPAVLTTALIVYNVLPKHEKQSVRGKTRVSRLNRAIKKQAEEQEQEKPANGPAWYHTTEKKPEKTWNDIVNEAKEKNSKKSGLEQKIPENQKQIDLLSGVVNPSDLLTDAEKQVYERTVPYSKTLKFVSMVTGKSSLLYASLINAESDCNSKAISNAGAYGLAQMTDIAMDELDRTIKFYDSTDRNPEQLKQLKILVGNKVDRSRYAKDPHYQIQVGAAYFDLLVDHFSRLQLVKDGKGYDFTERKTEFFEKHDRGFNSIEAAVSAYNYGTYATKKLLLNHGVSWRSHKPAETKTHWKRIVVYGNMLETIQDKLEKKLLASAENDKHTRTD